MEEKTDKELYKEFLLGRNCNKTQRLYYLFYTEIYQKCRYC